MHSLPSYTVAPAPSSRTRGFALLITITLVAFLVLILVTLASLTRVETTVAANSQQVSMARQNALAALNIALGELQKYAGPDQRATATADIEVAAPAAGAAKWTGVWGNANNPQSEAVADMASNPVRLQWLVSGNEQTAFDPATGMSTTAASFGQITTPPAAWEYGPADAINGVDASTTVNSTITVAGDPAALLVGPNTVGNNPGDEVHYVVAPLVDIKVPPSSVPGAGTSGSDVTVGKYAWWIGDEGVKARVNLVDPYVEPTPAMNNAGVAAAPASPFRLMSPQRMAIERVPGLGSFPINDPDARKLIDVEQLGLIDNTLPVEVRRERFHDLTTTSAGVLADQRRGGLKRDLTYAFAQTLPDYRAALGLPSATVNPLIPTTIMPANEQGPTWEQLHSFGNLDGSAAIAPQPQSATTHGLYPVLTQARLAFGGTAIPGSAGNQQFILHIYPIFVIANPYNVPIAKATYHVRLDVGAATHFTAYVGKANAPFWRLSLRALFEGQVFKLNAEEIAPGEAQIFTLTSSPADETWAPVKTYEMTNDWDVGAARIALNTATNGGSEIPDQVLYKSGSATATAPDNGLGVHLAFGDNPNPTTNPAWAGDGSAYNGYRINNLTGQQGGVLSWSLTDPDGHIYQRIETMGYAGWPITQYGIRGSSSTSVIIGSDNRQRQVLMRLSDSGNFGASSRVFPYYSQFNWRAPLVSRTNHFASTINAMGSHELGIILSSSGFSQWIRPDPDQPLTRVEWNGGVGANNSLPQARLNWQPFDVPRSPTGLVSVGQLQHFNAGGYNDGLVYPPPASDLGSARPSSSSSWRPRYLAPTHAIGNSRAHPNVSSGLVAQTNSTQPYYDFSYLLNRELFDGYFFSTYPQTGAVDLVKDRLRNPRLQPFRDTIDPTNTDAFRGTGTFSPDDVRLAARNLMLNGGFNINSTSEAAWRALLTSVSGTTFNAEAVPDAAFVRSIHQPDGSLNAGDGISLNAWNGFRNLTATQINTLAANIVAQIKLRGPSLALADFVNRKLVAGSTATSLSGPLQAAIDDTDINSNFPVSISNTSGNPVSPLVPTAPSYNFPAHLPPHGLEGIAGWLLQSDVLQTLAPAITARSDTFRIRTYGETRNPATGDVTGRAWCEATVQRLPDYVSPDADDAVRSVTALSHTDNQRFGRRFAVVDFRWLTPEDI